jgi:hypothetical protein
MFDWLKRCFGEGKIRVEGTLTDGTGFTAKISYIGDIDTVDKSELLDHVRRSVLVEHGERVATCRVVGFTVS